MPFPPLVAAGVAAAMMGCDYDDSDSKDGHEDHDYQATTANEQNNQRNKTHWRPGMGPSSTAMPPSCFIPLPCPQLSGPQQTDDDDYEATLASQQEQDDDRLELSMGSRRESITSQKSVRFLTGSENPISATSKSIRSSVDSEPSTTIIVAGAGGGAASYQRRSSTIGAPSSSASLSNRGPILQQHPNTRWARRAPIVMMGTGGGGGGRPTSPTLQPYNNTFLDGSSSSNRKSRFSNNQKSNQQPSSDANGAHSISTAMSDYDDGDDAVIVVGDGNDHDSQEASSTVAGERHHNGSAAIPRRLRGFMNGDFTAGKIHEIRFAAYQQRTFCMAYEPSLKHRASKVLAVGLDHALAFYETTNYSPIMGGLPLLPHRGVVSVMTWCNDVIPHATQSYLVVGTLSGCISIYMLDVPILESQGGPTLVYETVLDGTPEIRALTTGLVYDHDRRGREQCLTSSAPTFFVAAGTSVGTVTIISFATINSSVSDDDDDTGNHEDTTVVTGIVTDRALLRTYSIPSPTRYPGNTNTTAVVILGLVFQDDPGQPWLAVSTNQGRLMVLGVFKDSCCRSTSTTSTVVATGGMSHREVGEDARRCHPSVSHPPPARELSSSSTYALFGAVHLRIHDPGGILFVIRRNGPIRCVTTVSFTRERKSAKIRNDDPNILQSKVKGRCSNSRGMGLGKRTSWGSALWTESNRMDEMVDGKDAEHFIDFGEDNIAPEAMLSSKFQSFLAFGGYDKTVVLIDTHLWVISRELVLHGTVNSIALDPQGRFLAVGCRDKTLTLFDTSTFVAVKTFSTLGWVTCISWDPNNGSTPRSGRSCSNQLDRNILAIRSDRNCISILDLTHIHRIDDEQVSLGSRYGALDLSTAWSPTGQFVARAEGNSVVLADAWDDFRDVAQVMFPKSVSRVVFGPPGDGVHPLAAVDDSGRLAKFGILPNLVLGGWLLQELCSVDVRVNTRALAWSKWMHGGKCLIATGGHDHFLYVFDASDLTPANDPIALQGRVWDIDFVPQSLSNADVSDGSLLLAVALGDYTAVLFNSRYEPMLQISRSRTARCLRFHPTAPILAVGDGAGLVSLVDFADEELICEIDVGGRVGVVAFSPVGDYLVVGTDDGRFTMHDTTHFNCMQEFEVRGFALSASFSPDGIYLTLGSSNQNYTIVRLGPFLGLELIPLRGEVDHYPTWIRDEVLYQSYHGPSYLQRHMARGGSETLRRIASILRDHPSTVYTFDRETMEGCLETAMLIKKPNLLKLIATCVVDGTLNQKDYGHKSILTTAVPHRGRVMLGDIIQNYSTDFVVDVLKAISFTKVPFTEPLAIRNGESIERGSCSYTDPWRSHLPHQSQTSQGSLQRSASVMFTPIQTRGEIMRTPAVLPLPELGGMDLLAGLLAKELPTVFDNEAMGLVLRVLWKDHIRMYFYFDCGMFLLYYSCWISLIEVAASEVSRETTPTAPALLMSALTVLFNTLFAIKEVVQSRFGKRSMYWKSGWNAFDLLLVPCVYSFVILQQSSLSSTADLVPLAVVTSLLLTVKLLSYLRGFSATGWLISVLTANFRDVRGFLIILCGILAGFSVAFRLLFASTGDESYGSLRRSFLATFQATITAQYEPSLLYEAEHSVLAVITFVLAITCVLVVSLNALISILADSYARVQEHSIANRRRERAALIVEYMSLLPPWKRRNIEIKTTWFHTLLEVDADGDLLIQKDDWEGGLNALRRDFVHQSELNQESQLKVLDQMKMDLESDFHNFQKEISSQLQNISDDVKTLRRVQATGGITFSGRNVAKAVRAVRSVGRQGGALFGVKNDE